MKLVEEIKEAQKKRVNQIVWYYIFYITCFNLLLSTILYYIQIYSFLVYAQTWYDFACTKDWSSGQRKTPEYSYSLFVAHLSMILHIFVKGFEARLNHLFKLKTET